VTGSSPPSTSAHTPSIPMAPLALAIINTVYLLLPLHSNAPRSVDPEASRDAQQKL